MVSLLANPNLPLGSSQRTAAGTNGWQPPVGDRNAYSNSAGNVLQSGTNSGSSTEVSGTGLNPGAIVGVKLDGTDYNLTSWDAYNNAGAQYPVFTGMVHVSQLTAGVNFSYNASYDDTLALSDYTLTGPLGSAPWNDGLFQELNQSIIGILDSGDAYVPGS